MAKVGVIDGNYFLHFSFSRAGKHRNIEHIEKNTLTGFLASICNVALQHKCSHLIVCFDGPENFRKSIYKKYKANRHKNDKDGTTFTKPDGTEITTKVTVGTLVKPAKQLLKVAGITYSHKKSYESDDLMACVAKSLGDEHRIVIFTRDKDLHATITDNVSVFWPQEKKLMRKAEVIEYFGVKPTQIRDFLALVGDAVDNVPGVPGWGPKTAQEYLRTYGSIKKGLQDKEGYKKLKPYLAEVALAKKLVTLRRDQTYVLEDMTIEPFDESLSELVWKVPDSLKLLGDTRKASVIKGLFGKR